MYRTLSLVFKNYKNKQASKLISEVTRSFLTTRLATASRQFVGVTSKSFATGEGSKFEKLSGGQSGSGFQVKQKNKNKNENENL